MSAGPEVRPGGRAASPAPSAQRSPWSVLAVLCIGLFMILLDGTIVNIAIPHIMTSMHTDLSQVEWVMNGYVLVFAVSLVTLGRLGDLYGRRLLFVGGMALFTAASLACGLSTSIEMLIAFRVLQGLGGAAMMPSTLSIVAAVFPANKRGAAMGVWGAVSGLSTAIGPSLGGLIVDGTSWHWIFLINVPIGVASIPLTMRLVPESRNPTAVTSLDLPGVGLITASTFCLTFALVEGQNYGWTSPVILGLFGACAVLFCLFYVREHRERQPLIDFSLFRVPSFSAGNLTGLILSFGMMGVFFTIPIFLQTVLGYSAIKAGALMSPLSVAVMFSAPAAGRLSDKLGSRWLIAAGMLLMSFGIALMAGLTPFQDAISPSTSAADLILPFVICGFGIGLAIAPTTSAVMATAPMDRIGNASGVLSTMRQLGSVMGIAVLGAVLQNRAVHNIVTGIDGIQGMPQSVKDQIVQKVQSGGGRLSMPAGAESGPMASLFRQMFEGWLTSAIATTFVVAVVICLAGAVSAVFVRARVRMPGEAPETAPPAGEELPAGDTAAPAQRPSGEQALKNE